MSNSISYTTKSKERNPTRDPEKQLNSLAVISGRLLSQLIKEQRVGVKGECSFCISISTNYEGDIMENVVVIKVSSDV